MSSFAHGKTSLGVQLFEGGADEDLRGILSQKVVLENSETEFSGADETEVCSESGLCPPSSHVETERDSEGRLVYRIVADGNPGGEGGE
jgi:hypothetical protein